MTVCLNPEDMEWFDEHKQGAGSQRALLLALLAEHSPGVDPVEDTINSRRVQLGLTATTRPSARHGRMVPVNVSMRHDEAAALDAAARASGRTRSAYCGELIRLARST